MRGPPRGVRPDPSLGWIELGHKFGEILTVFDQGPNPWYWTVVLFLLPVRASSCFTVLLEICPECCGRIGAPHVARTIGLTFPNDGVRDQPAPAPAEPTG